jgi:hypothetical protein
VYLLSLSTLALLKCLLSLSFSPLCVCSMDAYMYMFGGRFGVERFRAQGLGQAVYMYICVEFTRVSCMCMCTRLRVYTCIIVEGCAHANARASVCVCH